MSETIKRITFVLGILAATAALWATFPPDVAKAQVALSINSMQIRTIDHDDHKFIVATNGDNGVSIIHHPDCKCLK